MVGAGLSAFGGAVVGSDRRVTAWRGTQLVAMVNPPHSTCP